MNKPFPPQKINYSFNHLIKFTITRISSFELCTSQRHLPPTSRFDILPNHLPPPPCCLATSCPASGSGNSWMSSRSHLTVTSSISSFFSSTHPTLHLLPYRSACPHEYRWFDTPIAVHISSSLHTALLSLFHSIHKKS